MSCTRTSKGRKGGVGSYAMTDNLLTTYPQIPTNMTMHNLTFMS